MKPEIYKLQFEDRIFHTSATQPSKLVKLGSGEILMWTNTRRDISKGIKYAVYTIPKIEDFSYIHMDTDIKALI